MTLKIFKPLAISALALLLLVALSCAGDEAADTPTPAAADTPQSTAVSTPVESSPTQEPKIYQLAITSDLTTTNYWALLGPDGTVWNQYALSDTKPTLYGYSDQRFDWVPSLATDFPSPLQEEAVGGQTLWTTQVELKQGVKWSDGNDVTAEDFAFTANTATEMELTGNWPSIVDPEFFDHAEALDPYTLKIYFNQKPGLARWQFGLAFMPIFPKAYWEPVVDEARQAGELTEQQKILYAHVPDGEPSAGGFTFDKWEQGAFAEKDRNADYYFTGSMVSQYENGAFSEEKPGVYEFSAYGAPEGEKTLEYTVGPFAESAIYSIYGSQDAAVLALKKGDVDFMLNPLGLSKGLQEQLDGEEGLTTIENADSGVRYLGFNFRNPPMDNRAFRQAVATLIDKEFLTETVLQGVAIPVYTLVPEGNKAWHNADVPKFGQSMSRSERVKQAVDLLKGAGFTWETEPRMSDDGNFIEQRGEGLKMPNGDPVPSLNLLAPSAGYDPLRSTFAIWIERWLNEVGIPLRADLTGFNLIVEKVYSQQNFDMWILGWGLTIFPDYLESFFHTRNSELEGYNPGGYNNPEYNSLADEFLAESDLDTARGQASRMQEFLAEDLPWVVLFTTPIVETFRSDRIEFPYTEYLGGLQEVGGLPSIVTFK